MPYSEGIRTSYRNPDFQAAYPFGHGLTYTTFDYTEPKTWTAGQDLFVRVTVRNTGRAAARAVRRSEREGCFRELHPVWDFSVCQV